MKKILLYLFLTLAAVAAQAADITTITIAVTNAAGTTNGQTVTINGNVRTWTNNVVVPGTQVLTNATAGGSATNLFRQLAGNPISGLTLAYSGTNGIALSTAPGGSLSVSISDGWGLLSSSTVTLTPAQVLRLPLSVEAAAVRTNLASQLAAAVGGSENTNAPYENSKLFENVVGKTNAQTVTGAKIFASFAGTAGAITNAALSAPALSNAVFHALLSFYNGEITITNSADNGIQFWSASAGAPILSLTNGNVVIEADSALQIKGGTPAANAVLVGDAGGGATWGTVPGTTNKILDSVSLANTNTVTGDLSFRRYAVTSLANGNNAAVPIGTNTFVEVSGPSGAFTVNGINGAPNRDGKFLILLNQTGQNMTIAHDSGTDPTAANRIYTMTGADRATTGNGAAMLIYSAAASRWILISFDP